MKKSLLIVYSIIAVMVVLGVIFIVGPNRDDESILVKNSDENKIDFSHATGTMISKEEMTEEEMKMHDAKVIQYALHNIKNVLQKDCSTQTNEELVSWYEYVEENLFLPKTQPPFEWLDPSLTALKRIGEMKSILLDKDNSWDNGFDVPKDVGNYEIHIYPSSETKEFNNSKIEMLWTSLRNDIDTMIEATDNYIGMPFEEK